MKFAHFASILAMTATLAVACDDSEDRVAPRHAAAAGTSGSAGKDGSGAGSSSGGSDGGRSDGGSGGGDVAGASGATELGGAGGNNLGGEPNVAAAGEAGTASGGAGGAGGEGNVSAPPLELIGAYDDNFGGSFVITQAAWGASAIAAYDNEQNVVYTQFPSDDLYNPNKFAKTVYTEPANDTFYFCMVVYDADTLAAAQASTATADPSHPDSSGCGGQFAWTKATKQ